MTAKNLDAALADLKSITHLTGVNAVRSRDQALADVTAYHSAEYIGPLLLMLDDASKDDESMFSLIHASEDFDDDVYVRELVAVLAKLRAAAPRWASILLMRVLNNDSTRIELVRSLRTASPESKEAIAWLCERINESSPVFMGKTVSALVAARSH